MVGLLLSLEFRNNNLIISTTAAQVATTANEGGIASVNAFGTTDGG